MVARSQRHRIDSGTRAGGCGRSGGGRLQRRPWSQSCCGAAISRVGSCPSGVSQGVLGSTKSSRTRRLTLGATTAGWWEDTLPRGLTAGRRRFGLAVCPEPRAGDIRDRRCVVPQVPASRPGRRCRAVSAFMSKCKARSTLGHCTNRRARRPPGPESSEPNRPLPGGDAILPTWVKSSARR